MNKKINKNKKEVKYYDPYQFIDQKSISKPQLVLDMKNMQSPHFLNSPNQLTKNSLVDKQAKNLFFKVTEKSNWIYACETP